MKLAVLDLETDPFKFGREPAPFAAGLYLGRGDDGGYYNTWGDNALALMLDILRSIEEPLMIFAHNGGRFDFWYMSEHISAPVMFVHGRLIKGSLFHHQLRDSFKILPIPLRDYKKDETDYATFEYGSREKHKSTILDYLYHDCVYLYELIEAFISAHGPALTIGSAAMKALTSIHPQDHERASFDEKYRPYFAGGRCQAFEHGRSAGQLKLYDVNSMYPAVMRNYQHPRGVPDYKCKSLPELGFYLARITARSQGALCLKHKGLKFPRGEHEFMVTSHELRAAIILGLVDRVKVHECFVWETTQNFREFVDIYSAQKIAAEESGDAAGRLVAKLLMNNAYGKFAQNPESFREYALFESQDELEKDSYTLAGVFGERLLGEKPAAIRAHSYNNVTIAASVTGAARAELMLALARAERPIYCDTDSIVCEGLDVETHPTKLGAWKLEAEFDEFYCAGKKLYVAYAKGVPIKQASKGVRLSPSNIRAIALGDVIDCPIDAPSLKLGQPAKFIRRTIAMTN